MGYLNIFPPSEDFILAKKYKNGVILLLSLTSPLLKGQHQEPHRGLWDVYAPSLLTRCSPKLSLSPVQLYYLSLQDMNLV